MPKKASTRKCSVRRGKPTQMKVYGYDQFMIMAVTSLISIRPSQLRSALLQARLLPQDPQRFRTINISKISTRPSPFTSGLVMQSEGAGGTGWTALQKNLYP